VRDKHTLEVSTVVGELANERTETRSLRDRLESLQGTTNVAQLYVRRVLCANIHPQMRRTETCALRDHLDLQGRTNAALLYVRRALCAHMTLYTRKWEGQKRVLSKTVSKLCKAEQRCLCRVDVGLCPSNYGSLLQNIVPFIGLFCKRDLWFWWTANRVDVGFCMQI